jgi:hypothetical protein
MKRHYRNMYPTEPIPARWPSVDLQQLDRSSHKSFIRVKPLHVAQQTEDELCLDQLYGELEELDREDHNVAINAWQISPWLLSMHWHEHIEGHDVSELRSLVAVPKKEEFPMLHEAIKNIFTAGTVLIDRCPELVLQCLNTPDPVKT